MKKTTVLSSFLLLQFSLLTLSPTSFADVNLCINAIQQGENLLNIPLNLTPSPDAVKELKQLKSFKKIEWTPTIKTEKYTARVFLSNKNEEVLQRDLQLLTKLIDKPDFKFKGQYVENKGDDLTLSMRGLAKIKFNSPEEAQKHGHFWWTTRIFVRNSKSEMERLYALQKSLDPVGGSRISLYAVIPNSEILPKIVAIYNEISDQGKKTDSRLKDLLARLKKSATFYTADLEGNFKQLSPEEMSLLKPEEIELRQLFGEEGPYFGQNGYHNPPMRGISELDPEALSYTTSGTLKKVVQRGRKWLADGGSIEFDNPDNVRALAVGAQTMVRNKQVGVVSRITDEEIDRVVELAKKGQITNTAVKDSSGNVVAGGYGPRAFGRLEGDTVFYPSELQPDGSVKGDLELAKVAEYATFIRAYKAGYRVIDARMVSQFTASMKGRYVDREYAHRLAQDNQGDQSLQMGDKDPHLFRANEFEHFKNIVAPKTAIVGGVSNGAKLAAKLKERGNVVIHVNNLPKNPSDYYKNSLNPKAFTEGFPEYSTHDYDFKELVETLRKLKVTQVLPGSEGGVRMAHRLSLALGVPSNEIDTAEARRNKFLMHKAVEEAAEKHRLENGLEKPILRVIRQEVFHEGKEELDRFIDWLEKHGKYPVAIKELDGAGGKNFYKANNLQEAIDSYHTILEGTKNAVLVGEYISGIEYVSNTVALEGKHQTTEQYIYTKVMNPVGDKSYHVYSHQDLIPMNYEHATALAEAHKLASKGLGINNGATHGEYFIDPNGEIILVEVGARVMGSSIHDHVDLAIGAGNNQIAQLADSITATKKFKKQKEGYKVQGYFRWISLINNRKGVKFSKTAIEKIKALPGFVKGSGEFKMDAELDITKDLYTNNGKMSFYSKDKADLDNALSTIREMEQSGEMYVPSTP